MITASAQSRNAKALIAASVQEQPELHMFLRYLLQKAHNILLSDRKYT